MSSDLLNILQHQELPIDNEQLIAYLTGKLTPAQEHEVERKLEASHIDAAVLEGLRHMKHPEKISQYTFEIDQDLRAKLKATKKHERKSFKPSLTWWIAGIVGLILFVALAWYMINYLLQK
jgi:anti-sigma factor RsiW